MSLRSLQECAPGYPVPAHGLAEPADLCLPPRPRIPLPGIRPARPNGVARPRCLGPETLALSVCYGILVLDNLLSRINLSTVNSALATAATLVLVNIVWSEGRSDIGIVTRRLTFPVGHARRPPLLPGKSSGVPAVWLPHFRAHHALGAMNECLFYRYHQRQFRRAFRYRHPLA